MPCTHAYIGTTRLYFKKYSTKLISRLSTMDDVFELPYEGDDIIRAPDLNYEPNPNGLGDEIFRMAKKHKSKVAQIEATTGRRDTYGTLLQRCIRTAIVMNTRGITSKDIVTLCSYNHLDSCVPYIAALFLGAKVATLDPSISFKDSKYLLNIVKPRIIFAVPESEQLFEDAVLDLSLKSEIVVFGNSDRNTPFANFLKESPYEGDFFPVVIESVHDTAAIFFSSGTTGLPKGICLSHYSLLSQSTNLIICGFVSEVVLSFSSLYWISAALLLVQSISAGTARLICPSFDPLKAWQYISKYGVTLTFMAPTQAMAMLKVGRPDGLNTTKLLDFLIGGGPISAENVLALRDLLPGTNVFQGYGQTEVGGVITVFKPNLRKDVILLHKKPGSSGRTMRGYWYKIVDLETEETLGPNRHGELRLKTKLQMNGYYNMDSSSAWDSDGWLRTGDVCYYDTDHCFYVVDRIKEMLKYRSWHVPPALLEGVLLEHPAVDVAVVIGKPHEEDGDHPLALVILSANANEDITPEELEEYVAERVDDRQKLRGGVMFIKEIPYTPTGKIKRKELRDMIIAQMP